LNFCPLTSPDLGAHQGVCDAQTTINVCELNLNAEKNFKKFLNFLYLKKRPGFFEKKF
jgi:hypothetical protein